MIHVVDPKLVPFYAQIPKLTGRHPTMNHSYAPVATDGNANEDEDARRYRRLGGGATFTLHEDGKGYSYSYGPSGSRE